MIIEVTSSTYRKGYGMRLDEVKESGLLEKLNGIVDWNQSSMPPVSADPNDDNWVENREFLGTPPQLKVGTGFKVGNQLLAIEDEDTVVLVMSETGVFGLQRIWRDKISKEISIKEGRNLPEFSEYSVVDIMEIPSNTKKCSIPYDITRLLFFERIIPHRPEMEGLSHSPAAVCLKASITFSFSVFPAEVYITSTGNIYYNPEDVFDLAWEKIVKEQIEEDLYAKFPPVKGGYVNPYQKRNEAVRVAKEMSQRIVKKAIDVYDEATKTAADADASTSVPEAKDAPWEGKLYYRVTRYDSVPVIVVELSDDPDFLEDHDYKKFAAKFENDFPEYWAEEEEESVFGVFEGAGSADEVELKQKLANHPDYELGNW